MERSGSFCAGVVTCILILVLAHGTQAQYGGGSGTARDPYQIATAADLIALGPNSNDYDKHFVLTADIDLDPNLPGGKVFDKAVIAPLSGVSSSGVPWNPPFTGVFDGNDHIISNLTIKTGQFLGLFGGLDSAAKVVNLRLESASVNGTGGYVGGLVGYSRGGIANCSVSGTVNGGIYVGGLLGSNNNGSVMNCCSAGTVTGKDYVGGLVGENWSLVANSGSSATVSGNLSVGGLVGDSADSIINSYSTGKVSGDRHVGGLVGTQSDRIINSYSTGAVSGRDYVGGLIGYSAGKNVISCFWDVQTSGWTTSVRGMGRTTAQMQDCGTFLNAGWDLAGESLNGTDDTWQLSPGGYPTLRYLAGEKPAMPDGAGTAEDPYLIRDACDLGTAWLEPQAYYRLEDSIDLAGITWGVAVIPWFGGSFDGNDHAISNLHIQGEHYLGLIGRLASRGTISRLGLEEVDVNGLDSHVGSFVGLSFGVISDSYSTGTIQGASAAGGLVGVNGGNIADSYNAARVVGAGDAGGIAANNFGSITNSSNRGTIAGGKWTGGLAGNNYKGSVVDCHNTGAVTGTEHVGGLLGMNSGTVAGSYSAGRVSGEDNVGGLVGYNYAGSSILNSYSTGRVVGIDTIGGLAGLNAGSITHSYSTGKIDGNWSVGGMLGSNKGQVLGCFWDIRTSNQAESAGGIGRTTIEMQTPATFVGAGWDFVGETANGVKDIWWILDGKDYPRLWWELEK